MTAAINLPAIVRGDWQDDGGSIVYDGETQTLMRPLPDNVVDRLVDRVAARTERLYIYSLSEIVDILGQTGRIIVRDWDDLMAPAIEAAERASSLSREVLRYQYSLLPSLFEREIIMRSIRRAMDPRLLDDWVEIESAPHSDRRVTRRAFGARSVHIIAGNSPLIGASTIIQSVVTRSDAILKIPSTDPLTVPAILRAMERVGTATDLLRHLSAIYWKGGEERVERPLLQSGYAEKIIAWGGIETVRNATRNMSHQTEVITFNPKTSRAIIDLRGATGTERREAARRLARDIAFLDQQACFNTRVAFLLLPSERSAEVIPFAELLSIEIGNCAHETCSAERVQPGQALDMELRGLEYGFDNHTIVRGPNSLLIASPQGSPVEFAELLGGRICNLVAVDSVDKALSGIDRSTQTLSIYPDGLRTELRNRAARAGVQRIVSCGGAPDMSEGGPHDGMEPLRRLVFWATDEQQPFAREPNPRQTSASLPPPQGHATRSKF